MIRGFHHLHLRKRLYQKLEPYPNPNKLKAYLDKAAYITGIVGPLMVLPQIIHVLTIQNATGVSLTTQIGLTLLSIFWLLYGLVHKEKPIIITNTLWLILQTISVVEVLIFG